MHNYPTITWQEDGENRSLRWHAESQVPPPKKIVLANDTIPADVAYKLACEGTGLLWQGDYHNGRLLLQALARRIDRKRVKRAPAETITEAFHQHRQAQAQRARILGMLLLKISSDFTIALRRAPDVAQACLEAYGPVDTDFVISFRELQGIVGAYEWRKKGVDIPALGERIHPHYGVFSPIRGEYVDLVAKVPLPTTELAFDIGTGTGVLAAMLVKRGVKKVIGTDQDARALACAKDNISRLQLSKNITLKQTDLFPEGRAALVVCNPPWVPAKPSSALEYAVYDPNNQMLQGFLMGLPEHLTPNGQGWLILSDIAEHLGLRTRETVLGFIEKAGLVVAGKHDIKPHHGRAADTTDPLHSARAKEVTSLWVLKVK